MITTNKALASELKAIDKKVAAHLSVISDLERQIAGYQRAINTLSNNLAWLVKYNVGSQTTINGIQKRMRTLEREQASQMKVLRGYKQEKQLLDQRPENRIRSAKLILLDGIQRQVQSLSEYVKLRSKGRKVSGLFRAKGAIFSWRGLTKRQEKVDWANQKLEQLNVMHTDIESWNSVDTKAFVRLIDDKSASVLTAYSQGKKTCKLDRELTLLCDNIKEAREKMTSLLL